VCRWSQVGVPAREEAERSLQLDTVTDIYIGISSSICFTYVVTCSIILVLVTNVPIGAHFSTFEVTAPPSHLWSIECRGGRRLDLEAPNTQLRDGWSNGILLLLKSHHIRVNLHQEGKLR
jgi:hypothetical protein